jgi:phage-related protein
MRKRAGKILNIRLAAFVLAIAAVSGIISPDNLNALAETGKSVLTESAAAEEKTSVNAEKNSAIEKNPENKKNPVNKNDQVIKENTIPEASTDITPEIKDPKTPVLKEEKGLSEKKEQIRVKAEEIMDHPEIILNAYKDAYPHLITDVIKKDKDWVMKFANGNMYYWADGKILPESGLPESDKYIRYSINPYNMNGRSPGLYTEEKIAKLRIKPKPAEKKKDIPAEEGSLNKELFAITTKKSAKKQLTEVKLSGHYIKVHHTIAEKIKSIDTKINQLAKTDPEVRAYLKSIGSVQAFNWRKIAGTDRFSTHSYGIAVDILPKKYRKKTLYWSWEQDKNEDWMLLPQSSLWTPPDSVIKIFYEENFIWGGHWDRYDTMHFEYRPELINLSRYIKFDQ